MNTNFNDTEIHDAIFNNNVIKVHQILKENHSNANTINPLNGDRPAHIAARFGRSDIMKMLVEYDVDLNCRNFNALTPLGEARMNFQTKTVSYIQTLFFKQSNGSLARRQYCPHLREYNVIENEYETVKHDEKNQSNKLLVVQKRKRIATFIQSKWRSKKAFRRFLYRKERNENANKIQQFYHKFKWKIRYQRYNLERLSAISIQSVQRKKSIQHYYKEFLRFSNRTDSFLESLIVLKL